MATGRGQESAGLRSGCEEGVVPGAQPRLEAHEAEQDHFPTAVQTVARPPPARPGPIQEEEGESRPEAGLPPSGLPRLCPPGPSSLLSGRLAHMSLGQWLRTVAAVWTRAH